MKESFDQHAGQRPSLPTGSRQEAQSCGSPTSTATRKTARTPLARRASRLGGVVASAASRMMEPYRGSAMLSTQEDLALNLSGEEGYVGTMAHGPTLFDRTLLRSRRRRAFPLGTSGFLLERVAEDAADRIATVLRRFEVALDLGTPGDALRRALVASGKVGTIIAADALIDRAAFDKSTLAVACDEEALPFRDASLDLVVSGLSLQFVNDLPGTLVQIRRALKPDGLFLAALIGGDTLGELRQAFAIAEVE